MKFKFPNAQLKGLKKIHLNPMEEKEVEIVLKDEAFGLYDEQGRFMLNQGEYQVFIGESTPDCRSIELMGKAPVVITVLCDEDAELMKK